MIRRNIGSSTFSAACEAESHLMTRSCFSGHRLLWCLTSSGNTRTSQTTTAPLFSRFSIGERADGALVDRADHPGLFERLARS
jgi:hypothetical protein